MLTVRRCPGHGLVVGRDPRAIVPPGSARADRHEDRGHLVPAQPDLQTGRHGDDAEAPASPSSLGKRSVRERTSDPLKTETGSLSEGEFLALLGPMARSFGCQTIATLHQAAGWKTAARREFGMVAEAAGEFEALLDAYHAKSNRTFAPLREFVASARGFALVAERLCVLLRGLGDPLPRLDGEGGIRFRKESGRTLDFARQALTALLAETQEEVSRHFGGSPAGETAVPHPPGHEVGARRRLLPTLDQVSVPEANRRIALMAARFLGHRMILERQSPRSRLSDPEEMRRYVLEVSDEQEVRFFEARIHTLVSLYDTYVQGTDTEARDPDLPAFRATIALVLILLEIMTHLVHFYERHEDDIRSEHAKNRVAELVDKRLVLDGILNYALHHVREQMDVGAGIAERLIRAYTKQARILCRVPDGMFLHIRPAALIARIVEHHGTPVTMTVGAGSCYAGSVLQVLMTVGAHPEIREFGFEGDRAPLEDLAAFFEYGLGEAPGSRLPETLAYLKA